MSHNMLAGLLYAILISTIIGIVWGKYIYQPTLKGWVAQYKTISTFNEAVQRCQSDGAVLMSPLRKELLDKMLSLIGPNTQYYIGVQTKFHPALFESIEGVLLDDMPVADMYEQLDPQKGECLGMTYDRISAVSCSSRLPYMCYKEDTSELFVKECGTFDKGYQLNNHTSHCYKFHWALTPWREAYFTCRAEDAYLAIIDDEKEVQVIFDVSYNKSHYVHVGLIIREGNGGWQSIKGTPIQKIYNTWENYSQSINNFAAINPNTGRLAAFQGNVNCNFVCEKDPNKIKFSYN